MKITHLDTNQNLLIQKKVRNTTKNSIYFVLNNYLKIQEKGNIFITFFVTIIILTVLLAIAFPKLFLGQGSKCEMSPNRQGKNAVGTLNRTQQAYHFEKHKFTSNLKEMGIVIPESQYYNFLVEVTPKIAYALSIPKNYEKDRVRSYSGAIFFDKTTNSYQQIICETKDTVKQPTKPIFTKNILNCSANMIEIK